MCYHGRVEKRPAVLVKGMGGMASSSNLRALFHAILKVQSDLIEAFLIDQGPDIGVLNQAVAADKRINALGKGLGKGIVDISLKDNTRLYI